MYIEEAWLNSIHGKSLYYPSAGVDMLEAFATFNKQVSKFYFCDLKYPQATMSRLVDSLNFPVRFGYTLVSSTQQGDIYAKLTYRFDEFKRRYRWLEPSSVTFTYEGTEGRQVHIIYRRGFGEMGLSELTAPELGVFMHRGDSAGEGGSGVRYLANKKKRFDPLSRLFDVIASRTNGTFIVVSDGSNTAFRELIRHKSVSRSGSEIYQQIRSTPFERCGFFWHCIGWMQPRYGPTLVWGLSKHELGNG
jgi:hypothetical protein